MSQDRSPRRARIGGSTSNLASPSAGGGHGPSPLSRSERDLTKVTKVKVQAFPSPSQAPMKRTKMKTTTMIVNDEEPPRGQGQGQLEVDVVRAPLDWQLADSTARALQTASDNLVQLYKRISLDHDLEESQRLEFLQKLTISAGSARSTLRPVVAVNSQSRSHHGNSSSVSPRRRR